MKTRAFIAVEAPPVLRDRIAKLIARLRASETPVKWVERQNLHWTIKFLGDVDLTDTAEICRQMTAVAAEFTSFDLDVRGVGAFPDAGRPRTIWVGVGDGADEMAALVAALDERLVKLGFPREPRRFTPHLTIGRVRGTEPSRELASLLAAETSFDVGLMPVEELVLFSSRLEREGPVYEALGHAELAP